MSDRDRDQSVEQWLRRMPAGATPTDDCLDADTLAAWSEGLLEGAERSSAESHASKCARCQAMLAVMARTTPVPASGTASPIRKWLMLLGPAMAAAAAVALWFAVDPSQRSAPSVLGELSKERAESAPATVPAPEPAASPALADKDRPSNAPGFSRWRSRGCCTGGPDECSAAGRACRRRETAGVVQREESGVGEIRSGSDRGREVSSDQSLGCPRCGPARHHRQRQRPRRWTVLRRREGMRRGAGGAERQPGAE